MTQLWTEKYRPQNINDYVWRDESQKAMAEKWIKDGVIPSILLTGHQGIGKTTFARMILEELNVDSGDILEINASKERKVDDIQSKILSFVSTFPLGDFKYVILDESDSISPLAQKMLRAEIENYSDTCRFILTANYKNKIIPALQSRCITINMESLDKDQFMDRIVNIALNEGIAIETEEDVELLNRYMELSYPDMRKCINLMQQNTYNNKLNDPREDETGDKDYLVDMIGMFASGQYTTARKLLVAQARPEEYEEIFRWFYQHLEIWGEEDKQNEALLIIRNALVNHALVADPEINMSAMIVELCSLL